MYEMKKKKSSQNLYDVKKYLEVFIYIIFTAIQHLFYIIFYIILR